MAHKRQYKNTVILNTVKFNLQIIQLKKKLFGNYTFIIVDMMHSTSKNRN